MHNQFVIIEFCGVICYKVGQCLVCLSFLSRFVALVRFLFTYMNDQEEQVLKGKLY